MIEDGSVGRGPGCMPIGRGRSGGGVRLRPVSGMRGEGGGALPRGAGASGALSSSLSFSACLAMRRASNCWIVSSPQK